MLLLCTFAPHFLLYILFERRGRWYKGLQNDGCGKESECKRDVSKILQSKTHDDLN